MKRIILVVGLLVAVVAVSLSLAPIGRAAGPEWVVVNPGDTLFAIAQRYGTSVQALISANNLPNANFVYSGQRLLIPLGSPVNPAAENPPAQNQPNPSSSQPSAGIYYTVRPGDTLAAIAGRYGVSVGAIAQANNLTNYNFVWYGQRLLIPGTSDLNGIAQAAPAQPEPAQPAASAKPVNPPVANNGVAAPIAPNPPTTGKWIDVNVSNQTITAYEGSTPLKIVIVSTGLPRTPTVLGTYRILSKYPAVRMTGGTPGYDYYDLPNVPYTMFFFQGYAIHGTYWHSNFGHPMSHGCVNLPTDEAKWFYEWAPIGTPVVSHS